MHRIKIDISGVNIKKVQAIVKALSNDVTREEIIGAFAHFNDDDLFKFQRMIMTILEVSHDNLINQHKQTQ